MRGKRKFIVALVCIVTASVAFYFTPKDIGCYVAYLGCLAGIVKLYSDANIKANGNEHKP